MAPTEFPVGFSDERTVIAAVLAGLSMVIAFARTCAAGRITVRTAARATKRAGEVVGAVHTGAPVTRAGRTRTRQVGLRAAAAAVAVALADVANRVKTVIACRLSPVQKSQLVRMMKHSHIGSWEQDEGYVTYHLLITGDTQVYKNQTVNIVILSI